MGIFHRILSVPRNIVMDLNNVTLNSRFNFLIKNLDCVHTSRYISRFVCLKFQYSIAFSSTNNLECGGTTLCMCIVTRTPKSPTLALNECWCFGRLGWKSSTLNMSLLWNGVRPRYCAIDNARGPWHSANYGPPQGRSPRGGSKYPHRAWLGGQVWWGSFFWPFPFWPLGDFFWFFLLNLGLAAPNYFRKPPVRSSKAPPN